MLSSWSISRRILSGFSLTCLIVVAMGVFAYLAVTSLGDTYKTYRQATDQTQAVVGFLDEQNGVRGATYKFRLERSDEARAILLEAEANLELTAEELAPFENDPVLMEQFNGLREIIADYRIQSAELVTQYGIMTAEAEAMYQQGREARVAMNELTDHAEALYRVALLNVAADVQEKLLLARFYSLNFQTSQKASDFERSMSEADLALENLEQVLSTSNGNKSIAIATRAIEHLNAFKGHLAEFEKYVRSTAALRTDVLDPLRDSMADSLGASVEIIRGRQQVLGRQGEVLVATISNLAPIGIGAVIVLVTLLAVGVARWINRPLREIASTTSKLADGDTEVKIVGSAHKHELGEMARSLEKFRDAHLQREQIAEEREQNAKAQQQGIVDAISTGLSQLADGNLTARITDEFAPEYESLKVDFNDALSKLEDVLEKVLKSISVITQSASDMNGSTQDLSHRTENQAATLEQTAAALDELTVSIKSSAEGAKEVEATVQSTRQEAERSGDVVRQAVTAMDEIEDSSKQISQITLVIEDIAFQTNLLALNAGVEAARAGESGRGFAVVASEVRALAQRSSQAAKEVTTLIQNSSHHVERGTSLVGDAGSALTQIIERVNHISDLISGIAASTGEQATGLSEINIGVNQLDQATQQNAGMVEASSRQGGLLAQEAKSLAAIVARFHVENQAAPALVETNKENITMWDDDEEAGLSLSKADDDQPLLLSNPREPSKTAIGQSHQSSEANNEGIWQDF